MKEIKTTKGVTLRKVFRNHELVAVTINTQDFTTYVSAPYEVDDAIKAELKMFVIVIKNKENYTTLYLEDNVEYKKVWDFLV